MAQKTILELDLLAVARNRRHLSLATGCLSIVLVGWLLWFFNTRNPDTIVFISTQVVLGLLGIWVIVSAVLLQISMGIPVPTIVLTAIAAFFLPWLIGIALISQSTTILKLAGAKTGLFGLSPSERAKITPGHCRGCGYDRTGLELLQECPECQRVPQVI